MGRKTYCYVSGAIFGLVAVLHLLRLVNHCPAQIGSITIPELASIFGAFIGAALCLWAFRVAKK